MERQQMILESQREEMLANWERGCELAAEDRDGEHDPRPVVKLFNPVGAATWLLTELVADSLGDDGEPDTAFGLCDLGQGMPELGYVSLSELRDLKLFGGAMYIERDIHFTATKTLSEYAADARAKGRIEAY
jgi:hypothetical protein